ncbi:D-lactate ferricytochrome c oxidoreductase [Thecaphora frezii]
MASCSLNASTSVARATTMKLANSLRFRASCSAASRRHLSHTPVNTGATSSPASASSSSSSASSTSQSTARSSLNSSLRPLPASQLAAPSRCASISQPLSFSALLRSSPGPSRGATLVLGNRSFASSSSSQRPQNDHAGSRAATLTATAPYYGRIAAAIAALSIAANFYLLSPSSSGSDSGAYLYSNPRLKHEYGSTADFDKAISDLKSYFAQETGDSWKDHVSQDETELERRGFDENGHAANSESTRPSVVVWPRNTEDVVEIVRIANKYKMPMVPFSGGTSLEGHYTAPYAGISVDMSRMSQILAFRPEDGDMTVQSGLGWEAINAYLASQSGDFFFPLDPGPGATIGGMIGTGCSGTNAVRYGTARGEHWLNLKVVLPNGEVIETRGGRRSRKSSAGFDLGRLLIGAEGTLGIVTEATIRLQPRPVASAVACAPFDNVELATRAVNEILLKGVPIQCIELLDNEMMKAINESNLCGRTYEERDSLFFKLSGTKAAVEEAKGMIIEASTRHGAKRESIEFETDVQKANQIWQGRKQALYAVAARCQKEGERVWTTDVCVPISALPRLVRETQADLRSLGLTSSCIVGHAGDGNFHGLIPFDSNDAESVRKATEAVGRMCHRAQDLDGTCTGEHGVGSGKVQFLERELGDGTLRLMKAVKLLLDPHNLMNPGKLYPQ